MCTYVCGPQYIVGTHMCTYVCGPQSVEVRDVQVEGTYPELAELLLVVIKTLLSRDPQFTVSQGVCVCASFETLVHQN